MGALFRGEEVETASPDDLRFEAPLKVVEYPNPVLRKKNKRIGTFDENLKRLVDQMFDVMYKIWRRSMKTRLGSQALKKIENYRRRKLAMGFTKH